MNRAILPHLRDERARVATEIDDIIETARMHNQEDLSPAERARHDVLEARFDALTAEIQHLDPRSSGEPRPNGIRSTEDDRIDPTDPELPHRAGLWLGSAIRALVGAGTTGGGAFTPAEEAAMFLDLLAAQSVGLRSGFSRLETDRDSVVIPRVTTDVGAGWFAEAATISSTDLAADQVTATPRKLAGIQVVSNEALRDSKPELLSVIARSLIRAVALKLDLGFYEGSGTAPEIRGLKNVSGIQTVSMGTNGAALANLDPFADAIGLLEQENAEAAAIVMHPRTWKAILKLKETSTSNKPLVQDEIGGVGRGVRRSLYGVPVFLTSQLSVAESQGTATNASSAYVYEADQVLAVIRNETEVRIDESRLFNSDQSEIRAIMRADLVVQNVKAVVRVLGIIP